MSYYTVITDVGQAKLANATALGQTLQLATLGVGDGGGSTPTPDPAVTALLGEWRRAPLNQVSTDPENPNYIICEQVIPEDTGGFWIREVGIYDVDGNLIAYGNFPPTYKPLLSEGSGRTQTIRVVLMVSDTGAITLKIDPAVVLATRKYADDQRAAHEASRNHPAASTAAQGMVELADHAEALAGTDTTRAMSPLRVHEAMQAFGIGGNAALVQVNSDINSLTKTGFYRGYQLYNAPTFGEWWYVQHIAYGATDYAKQIAYGLDATNAPRILQRSLLNGTWSGWTEILQTDSLTGQVAAFATVNAPAGWLVCNGALVSRTTYAALFARIGTSFSAGDDPTTTFRLPDLRGEFIRGFDFGRGVDTGRSLGSWQPDELKSHTHTYVGPIGGGNGYTNTSNGGATAATGSTGAAGGTETRPRNVALLYCIKY